MTDNETRFVLGNTFGKELCEALGLDPELFRSLTIKATVGGMATVEVDRMVSADELPRLIQAIERYGLARLKTDDGEDE